MPIFLFVMALADVDPLNLRDMFAPVVTTMGYELVGVEYSGAGRGGVLRVYIDQPDGVTVDDCQAVSYQLSGLLDVEDPIRGNYTLEVSSPGLDRPLFEIADFERFAGEQVTIQLSAPVDGRRKYKGTLKGVRDKEIVIEVDGTEIRLPYSDIARARLVPQF